MKKLSITLPKLPTITKRVLIIAAASVVLIGLFTFSVVRQVQAERRIEAVTAAKQAEQEKAVSALRDRVSAAETATSAERARSEQICSWVRGVQAQRKQPVPPLCVAVKI